MNDLLRGRALDDVVESLPELWDTCLRVRDDIKESVRNAADLACKTLSRVCMQCFMACFILLVPRKAKCYGMSKLWKLYKVQSLYSTSQYKKDIYEYWGAQWPSGRVHDSRPRGRGFEPH